MDPQVLVLTPENAWKIGRAIVSYGEDYYLRAKEVALKALEIIETASGNQLRLPNKEGRAIKRIKKALASLPETSESFIEECLSNYKKAVTNFRPSNYGL